MPEFDYEKWKKDIERLKKNREKVPEEKLKTVYAKPYRKLLDDISQQTTAMLNAIILSHLPVMKDWDDDDFPEDKKDVEDLITRIKSVVAMNKISGQYKRIGHAIYKEYDADKAVELAERIRTQVEREAYAPYWEKHCTMQEDDTIIWNDIISMRWLQDNIWIDLREQSFQMMYPPPKKLIRKLQGGKTCP